MKTLKDIREELADVSSHSNRKLKTIIANPKHPHHAAAKAELDRRSMQEKTLTPAEKKKREEIAKAMERENPDMPMAKKMAIATATAKKVAEEADQIDEAMTSAHKKLAYDVHKQLKRDDSMALGAGLKLKADHKMLMSKYGSDWRKKAGIKESVDFDEAAKDYGPGHIGAIQKMLDKEREAKKAKEVMKKESVEKTELEELNKSTLASYTQKAAGSLAGNAAAAGYAGGQGKKAHPDIHRHMKNRTKGIQRAAKKLADVKESIATAKRVAESIEKMSSARLKYHATKKFPHGSFTDKEIKDEHKRRQQSEPNYHTVKPALESVEQVDEKSKGLWANIHAKRKRGEKPNPPGHPDRPTKADFERSQK